MTLIVVKRNVLLLLLIFVCIDNINAILALMNQRNDTVGVQSFTTTTSASLITEPAVRRKTVVVENVPQPNVEHSLRMNEKKPKLQSWLKINNSDAVTTGEDVTDSASMYTMYVVPEEGTMIVFRCATVSDRHLVRTWVLPNGERISLNTSDETDSESSAQRSPSFTINKNDISFSKYEMIIYAVKLGMDGRYTCLFDALDEKRRNSNETNVAEKQRSFFIPHIVSQSSFLHSVALSAGISILFCVICVLVLWINSDRWRVAKKTTEKDEGDEFMRYGTYAFVGTRRGTLAAGSTISRTTSTATSGTEGISANPTQLARRKTHVYPSNESCASDSWVSVDANESESASERKKYLSRSFSMVGFDDILPTCIEKSPENSSAVSTAPASHRLSAWSSSLTSSSVAEPDVHKSEILNTSTLPRFPVVDSPSEDLPRR